VKYWQVTLPSSLSTLKNRGKIWTDQADLQPISLSSALLIFFTLMIGFILGWSLHSYFLYRKFNGDPKVNKG